MKQKIKLALIGLLTIVNLNANEMLFDLKAQNFQYENNAKNRHYKLSDQIIFETDMYKVSNGSFYRPAEYNLHARADIHLAQPIKNWKYSLEMSLDIDSNDHRPRMISIRDINENFLICILHNNGLILNGKEFVAKLKKKNFILQIEKQADTVTAYLDGEKFYETKIKLGDIKKISTGLASHSTTFDRLYNLTLLKL